MTEPAPFPAARHRTAPPGAVRGRRPLAGRARGRAPARGAGRLARSRPDPARRPDRAGRGAARAGPGADLPAPDPPRGPPRLGGGARAARRGDRAGCALGLRGGRRGPVPGRHPALVGERLRGRRAQAHGRLSALLGPGRLRVVHLHARRADAHGRVGAPRGRAALDSRLPADPDRLRGGGGGRGSADGGRPRPGYEPGRRPGSPRRLPDALGRAPAPGGDQRPHQPVYPPAPQRQPEPPGLGGRLRHAGELRRVRPPGLAHRHGAGARARLLDQAEPGHLGAALRVLPRALRPPPGLGALPPSRRPPSAGWPWPSAWATGLGARLLLLGVRGDGPARRVPAPERPDTCSTPGSTAACCCSAGSA